MTGAMKFESKQLHVHAGEAIDYVCPHIHSACFLEFTSTQKEKWKLISQLRVNPSNNDHDKSYKIPPDTHVHQARLARSRPFNIFTYLSFYQHVVKNVEETASGLPFTSEWLNGNGIRRLLCRSGAGCVELTATDWQEGEWIVFNDLLSHPSCERRRLGLICAWCGAPSTRLPHASLNRNHSIWIGRCHFLISFASRFHLPPVLWLLGFEVFFFLLKFQLR